jgi:hypothetical protein
MMVDMHYGNLNMDMNGKKNDTNRMLSCSTTVLNKVRIS